MELGPLIVAVIGIVRLFERGLCFEVSLFAF